MIFENATLTPDLESLTAAERAQLKTLGYTRRRGAEWIRGRLAVRRTLGVLLASLHQTKDSPARQQEEVASVLTAPDGAPYLAGGLDYAVSLSHDGAYVAVALGPDRRRRLGVDLCLRAHAARAQRILDRLAVVSPPLDPVLQWAALECVLKLRRRSVTALLDATLSLERRAEALVVRGLGAPAVVHPSAYEDFVVCTGASRCRTS